MITIANPVIEEEEIDAVNQVLRSGILAQGSKVAQLEADFADYCGTKYAAAVSSGTAALHAALYAVGVKTGDEVVTTPFSFIATINPILFQGAKPVLVDIDPKTYNIDVKKLEKAITSKTKAIMPVHLYGQPCDYAALSEIAKQHDLSVIEDACQAVGASHDTRKTGSLGDLGCFSLYATKNIMCGEGGVVTSDNEAYIMAIKRFRQHGMAGPYEYADIGYNYRLTDLQAAIAVEQLKKVDEFTAKRQRNAKLLNEGLHDIPNIVLPVTWPGRTHVYHQYTIRLTEGFSLTREQFVEQLKERGIGSGIYYPKPLHLYPHIAKFGYRPGDFPEAEQAGRQVLSLPVHPKVTESDIQKIVSTIRELASV